MHDAIDCNFKIPFLGAREAAHKFLDDGIGLKKGMTRRLDPMDRIRELSDASVPFNFDVHALFFSKDAVGIEAAMHDHFAELRLNMVNYRREFFRATPVEVKVHLATLAGELLEFQEKAEALEYRQCLTRKPAKFAQFDW